MSTTEHFWTNSRKGHNSFTTDELLGSLPSSKNLAFVLSIPSYTRLRSLLQGTYPSKWRNLSPHWSSPPWSCSALRVCCLCCAWFWCLCPCRQWSRWYTLCSGLSSCITKVRWSRWVRHSFDHRMKTGILGHHCRCRGSGVAVPNRGRMTHVRYLPHSVKRLLPWE